MISKKAATAHACVHKDFTSPAKSALRVATPTDNYPRLQFRDLYATLGIIGLRLTEQAKALHGRPVVIRGYMAPPLTDQGKHFVLTKAPLHTCPFCDDGARWPDDALPTFLSDESHFVEPDRQIEVAGELQVLSRAEAEAEGLRLLRLNNAAWKPL